MANIWFFEQVDLFDILCPHKMKRYENEHGFKEYARGDYIYFSDDLSRNVYLIAHGKVKIFKYGDTGEEVVKSLLSRGEVFGEMAIFGEEKREDFAIALTDETMLCQMNIAQLKELMLENAEFAFRINKLVGLRVRKLERRIDSLVFKDVKTRIIEFLKEYAAEKGIRKGNEVFIQHYFTHKDMADLLGTKRQTVTSILNELQSRDMLSIHRKTIHIKDIHKLSAV